MRVTAAWRWLALAAALGGAVGRACEGEDLPPDSKLIIDVTHRPKACAESAKPGDMLRMHFKGTLYSDCYTFQSYVYGQTFDIELGKHQIVRGLDDGLLGIDGHIGICPGEKRKLTVPSGLAYGAKGMPAARVHPNATLQFEVEALEINPSAWPKERTQRRKKKKRKRTESREEEKLKDET